MHQKPFNVVGLSIIFSLGTWSCRHVPIDDALLKANVNSNYTDVLWPNPQSIPMCWEPEEAHQMIGGFANEGPKPGEIDQFKTWIRERFTAEFGKAGIGFSGWTACKPKQAGIHILINAQEVAARGIGRSIDGMYAGLMVNYPRVRGEWAKLNALHEMGHALGLRHESSRVEARVGCPDFDISDQGEPSAFSLGPYEQDSIMNYCLNDLEKERGEDNIARLAPGDIAALKEMYSGAIAEINEIPPLSIGVAEFPMQVRNVDTYRVKYGAFDKTSCQKIEGYSEEISSKEPFILTRKPSASGEVRICLLGTKGVKKQALATASEYYVRVIDSPVFADYRLPGSMQFSQTILLPMFTTNSSTNIGKVKVKIIPVFQGEHATTPAELDCNTSDGYKYLSDIKNLKLEVITKPHLDMLKLCILATDKQGLEQSQAKANEFYYFMMPPSRSYIVFFPETFDFPKTLPKKIVLVFYGNVFESGPKKISYAYGSGTDCASNWVEQEAHEPLVLDLSKMKSIATSLTLCVKQQTADQVWEQIPSIKKTWTKKISQDAEPGE